MIFKHLSFVVKNLEKSIEFYETITELSLSRRFKSGDAELAFLSNGTGETEIELISMPSMEKFQGKGFFLCFETDQLDAMHTLSQEKGLNPSDIRNPDEVSRYFYVYDPDGVSIQLKQKI